MGRKEIFLMARDLMSKHSELDLWRFSFENYKKSFGRCNYTTRTISISSYLCDSMTNIAIKDTLIHEIAHALTRGHGHDNVWKSVCLEVGAMPERYGKINDNIKEQIEKKIKYTVVCNCCGKEFKYQSKSKIIKAIENGTANTLYHCSCGCSNRTHIPMQLLSHRL